MPSMPMTITFWPALRDTPWMMDLLGDREAVAFWADKFDRVHDAGIRKHGWDWPWLFACWAHRGLSILPSVNLITNIGFGEDATHTKRTDDERAFVPVAEMPFPLRHPPHMVRDVEADRLIVEQVGLVREPTDLFHRVRRACINALPRPLRRSLASMERRIGSSKPPRNATWPPSASGSLAQLMVSQEASAVLPTPEASATPPATSSQPWPGTLTPQRSGSLKGTAPDVVRDLNGRIRDLCRRYQNGCADLYAAFGNEQSPLIGADGLHPTPAGYDVIAETFFDVITRLFERTATPAS